MDACYSPLTRATVPLYCIYSYSLILWTYTIQRRICVLDVSSQRGGPARTAAQRLYSLLPLLAALRACVSLELEKLGRVMVRAAQASPDSVGFG